MNMAGSNKRVDASVYGEVLDRADSLRRSLNMSRSKLITCALALVLKRHGVTSHAIDYFASLV